ncbi:MAG: hypothetical protein ACI837_000441 [Crocinitomicaceae bacterium]|jgi:hypothetical protein
MKFFVSIALISLLMGCSSEIARVPEPSDLIPKAKMIDVVREMVKLESFIQTRYVQEAVYHKVMMQSGDSLLKAHKVDRKQYEGSIDYYGSRQDEMQDIYAQALEDLNEELSALETEITEVR